MTSVRQAVRRRFLGARADPSVDTCLSYRFYWVGQVRTWGPERRGAVAEAVQALVESPSFIANEFQRRYTVPGLDDQAHSGLSLQQLHQVLQAMVK